MLDSAASFVLLEAQGLPVERAIKLGQLWIHPLGARRETNQIAEQDRDDLPFVARRRPPVSGAAQARQKRAISGFSCPQSGQIGIQRA